MHIQDIEHLIRESIMDLYGKQYIGKLKIEPLETKGYCVTFGMNNTNLPIVICAELDDIDFIKYIKQELKTMRLDRVKYGTLTLIDTPKYIECQRMN